MKLSLIEHKILACIKKATKKNWNKDKSRPWTIGFKKELTKLGKQLGYKVSAAPQKRLKAQYGEWLYDLCWIKEGRDWTDFKRLELIAEIEWNNDDVSILEDFLKLTVGIAHHRLIITYYNEKNRRAGTKLPYIIYQNCKKASPNKRDLRYLLIIIDNRKNIKHFLWKK